ncbi:MAG TPA: DUF2905 domain-containing protein [Deltaproteobacteria bacterium]|jgi:uncharacterized membrane-anchored protein|nr:DUF2905 domain-containing protein [Deltaproteobacteria bacterium]HOI05963.1 DUF2905 domain-containing protein [Deltaproteobacteria bacterium]
MKNLGLTLIVFGFAIALAGVLLYAGVSFSWLGRLPGDIRIVKPGYSIYIPITTCILVSIVVSIVFYIIRALR